MKDPLPKPKILLARLALVLMVAFVAVGLARHGLSLQVFERIWHNLLQRPGGPMSFRFVLQPLMASMAALIDGIKDARTGRNPYLWVVLTQPAKRSARLGEALISTARVILLGLAMDLIYQIIEFNTFHPAEAVLITCVLAIVPYLLLRGPFSRMARWWLRRGSSDGKHRD